MNAKKVFPLVAFAVLSCYAIQGQPASQPKSLSYEEASLFERRLIGLASYATPKAPETVYIQPVNKAEPCKLPTTQDQLDLPNIRDYWDGECKNGFAFGFGRTIVISDTRRVDEIIVHSGTAAAWSGPVVVYDYVNNTVTYAISGSKYPAQTALSEKMVNSFSGFNAYQTLSVVDELGKIYVVQSSAFQPQRTFLNTRTDNGIAYKFTDNSAAPVTNQNEVISAAEVDDPKTNKPGVAVVRYANATRNFTFSDGKPESVQFPNDYVEHLLTKYREVANAASAASINLQRAQQMEREYLYKACNSKSGITGLDNSEYTKICTWRDQFKEPYATASANYQRQIESLKQQAAIFQQQLGQQQLGQQQLAQQQQQLAEQQQILQQQQKQKAWSEISQQLDQLNQQLQQQTQQTMQGVNSWQPPQVQPIAPPHGNTVICNTIGSITTCR